MNNYISCCSFGWRLGNQMFQYATLLAYAKLKNKNIAFDTKHSKEHLFKCFDIKNVNFIENLNYGNVYHEHKFSFNSELFHGNFDSINGYFQSEKYFKNVLTDLKSNLIFKNKGVDYSGKCFIHVRRGDYLKYPDIHPTCSNSYYDESIQKIKNLYGSDTQFVIFSDDINECKKYSCFKRENIFFDETEDTYLTLQSMTSCMSGIIANSSFSWWGAWLINIQKTVIAPKIWFGKNGTTETQDIYCSDWIII